MIIGSKEAGFGYRLYKTAGMTCADIAEYLNKESSIIGLFALCTSVDSGIHGFPELGSRIGKYTGLIITSDILADWPTYSGAYDEWYVFKCPPSDPIQVAALCNWGCDFLEYEQLSDCLPQSCKMDQYLENYLPLHVFGCNEEDGYIFSHKIIEI